MICDNNNNLIISIINTLSDFNVQISGAELTLEQLLECGSWELFVTVQLVCLEGFILTSTSFQSLWSSEFTTV